MSMSANGQAGGQPATANPISFMSANYVARELGYQMTRGWGQGDAATNAYFRPIETFEQRFGTILRDIKALGFDALDIWTGHLNWSWATDRHLGIARELLEREGFTVASLAGGFGSTPADFEAACNVAVAVGTTILGGSSPLAATNRPLVVALLHKYGLRLALENHPDEKTPEDMLKKIGDGGEGRIGTAVDTGWYGTNGYDAARAIERLGDYVIHVHLKDVLAAGAHDTCRFGQGVVPIEDCVRVLQRMNYRGAYSIEHEPDHYDPSEDCRAMLPMLRGWLQGAA